MQGTSKFQYKKPHNNKGGAHLLIWIRVIVESNPAVVCDFREIFIIKLLQADVVGRPGNTRDSTLTTCCEEEHWHRKHVCPTGELSRGKRLVEFMPTHWDVLQLRGRHCLHVPDRGSHTATSSVFSSLITIHTDKMSVVQQPQHNWNC